MFKTSELEKASIELTACYKAGARLKKQEHFHAYCLARMPATYAVASKVLEEVKRRWNISSLLDLGAGPGTVLHAAKKIFPELKTATLVEREEAFIKLAAVEDATWIQENLEQFHEFPLHDLVIFSYSLNEIQTKHRNKLLKAAWNATKEVLVIIEPGTPSGYDIILEARDCLSNLGGFILAPCPHGKKCPLEKPDWCHFSVRLPRSSLHRQIKQATLGYEDEKYSYVIVGKSNILPTHGRILATPRKRSGHVYMKLCTEKDVREQIISKRYSSFYKRACKSVWGDELSDASLM